MAYLDCAVNWFQTHAQIIALIEFAALVVGAIASMFAWLFLRGKFREQKERADLAETQAEARHRELVALNEVVSQLTFATLNDDYTYAELPPGTRLVRSKSGRLHLAPPVRLNVEFSGTASGEFGPVELVHLRRGEGEQAESND